MKGFKFHPNVQAFFPNDRHVYPLYEVIAEAGLPSLFHTGHSGIGSGLPGGGGLRLKYSNPIYVDDVAADFPEMPIVLAHPSFPWQDEALSIAMHKPQVYIDLSGWSPKYFPPQLVQYANTLLKHQVLFGSDYPMITPDRWLNDFEQLEIDDEVRAARAQGERRPPARPEEWLVIDPGGPAPDFTLPTRTASPSMLSALRGRWALVYFYPKADTPGCTAQACSVRDHSADYEAANAVVLGVSPDPVADLRAFADKYGLAVHAALRRGRRGGPALRRLGGEEQGRPHLLRQPALERARRPRGQRGARVPNVKPASTTSSCSEPSESWVSAAQCSASPSRRASHARASRPSSMTPASRTNGCSCPG